MAALVPTKRNAVIHPYCQRLVAADKPKKPALVACRRKLLTILNVMAGTGQHWDARQSPPPFVLGFGDSC
jgi:transposase